MSDYAKLDHITPKRPKPESVAVGRFYLDSRVPFRVDEKTVIYIKPEKREYYEQKYNSHTPTD